MILLNTLLAEYNRRRVEEVVEVEEVEEVAEVVEVAEAEDTKRWKALPLS